MLRPGNPFDQYQNALVQSIYRDQVKEAERAKNRDRFSSMAQAILSHYLGAEATPAVGPLATGGYTSAAFETGASNAGVPIATQTGTTVAASGGAGIGAGIGAGGSAALAGEGVGTGAGVGTEAGSGVSTASSGLSSTGIGAIVAAGIATGSATPGSWLFPLKKLGYDALHNVYKYTGGNLGERLFTGGENGWGPEAMVNKIFGDPHEQERQVAERNRKIALAKAMGYVGNSVEQQRLANKRLPGASNVSLPTIDDEQEAIRQQDQEIPE